MNSMSKRNRRKENRVNEMNQPTGLQDALKQIAELKEQLGNLEGKYSQKRDADARSRARVQELEKKLAESEKEQRNLSRQLEIVMKDRAVPIVSGVVMKAMYKKAAGIKEKAQPADGQAQPADGQAQQADGQAQPADGQAQPANRQDGRAEKIRGLGRQFLDHGYDNAQQVTEFADLWEVVILERNTAAHAGSGDDVIAILPYCGERHRHIPECAFRSLWGISTGNWETATPEQKEREIRNCTDCEPDRLG